MSDARIVMPSVSYANWQQAGVVKSNCLSLTQALAGVREEPFTVGVAKDFNAQHEMIRLHRWHARCTEYAHQTSIASCPNAANDSVAAAFSC